MFREYISKAHIRMPTKKCLYSRSHHVLHNIYFGAAFMEGHGIYAFTAGGLFVISVMNSLFLHFEEA